jgi:hypothetical protein
VCDLLHKRIIIIQWCRTQWTLNTISLYHYYRSIITISAASVHLSGRANLTTVYFERKSQSSACLMVWRENKVLLLCKVIDQWMTSPQLTTIRVWKGPSKGGNQCLPFDVARGFFLLNSKGSLRNSFGPYLWQEF